MALTIFLCHSSRDKPAVRLLRERLQSAGFNPWLDEEDLLPGQDWDLEIQNAIRRSDIVLVCLSADSVTKRGYVQKEIKTVLDIADELPDGTVFVIPARLEDCEVPLRLQRWQWVDLFVDEGYQRLTRALQQATTTQDPSATDGPMPVQSTLHSPDTRPLGRDDASSMGTVRFDGLYVLVQGDYRTFIRFFSEGIVMDVSSTGNADQVRQWLLPGKMVDPSQGTFQIRDGDLTFSTTSSYGTVEYRGSISQHGMELHLHSRSLINGHESYGVWRFTAFPS